MPPEIALVADEFVREVEIEGRKVKLPEVIIAWATWTSTE